MLSFLSSSMLMAQESTEMVNVFLGSSGDHGQMSPGASAPFHQMNIVPLTDPGLHTGYEHLAKNILGFTHNRFEGVGCRGAGGLFLVRPFIGEDHPAKPLYKVSEHAEPGFYSVKLREGLQAGFAVNGNFGIHEYLFPPGKKGLTLDLHHAFNQAFVSNEYIISEGVVSGKIRARTTCSVGIYTIYYAIAVDGHRNWFPQGDTLMMPLSDAAQKVQLRIAFSAVDTAHALACLRKNRQESLASVRRHARGDWNTMLSGIRVQGRDKERIKLFYSLLYRVMQSPYKISESDGNYRGTDGLLHHAAGARYHGWAVWDNFKTQLPLLELMYPALYQDIVSSIAGLYKYGKYDFAGPQEPANSVRTEHSAVVLLDALRKGYDIHLDDIKDSLEHDTSSFDFSKPDKYLEGAYDLWAMSKLDTAQRAHYLARAAGWKVVWDRDFKDLTKNDVDRMSARNMYQGTIRQYRWNVPYDVKGLIDAAGGKQAFTSQLDDFFDNFYFNRANEPDIESPTLYYASARPWKYQQLVHQLAVDTVVQYYFNDNSRGIDPFIDRIYKNEPKAFIRTMDDDAGAMSAWFILTALGLHQPLVGAPVYYLNVPLFPELHLQNGGRPFVIKVKNFSDSSPFIKRVSLNGRDLGRLWLTHEEIRKGGELLIESSSRPSTYGNNNLWVSEMQD